MVREGVGAGWRGDLERWLAPFLERLGHRARQRMCPLYVAGLIGPGDRKSIQPMAERLGLGTHDRLHHFVSAGNWDAAPLLEELARKADDLYPTTDPAQYPALIEELAANDGALDAKTRWNLAVAAFNRVAQYDAAISDTLSSIEDANEAGVCRTAFPEQTNGNFIKVMDLRYGENPHQKAAFYRDLYPAPGSLATFSQLQGKELSFNNLADADAAWECVRQFEVPACVIVKHANPCGVALGAACGDAYELAYATDPTSAFGGIIAFNTPVNAATMKTMLDRQFVEVLIAPDYDAGALEYASRKANVRVLQIALAPRNPWLMDVKRVGSGLLMQNADVRRCSCSMLTSMK